MTASVLINIDVDDLERAIAFYRAAVGLHLGRRLFGNSAAELIGASSAIYLLAKPAGSSASPQASILRDYARHWTPVHLDFVVEEVDAAIDRALAAGARLEGELESHAWGRIATLSDPFGNGFCLLQFSARGYDAAADPPSAD